MTYINPQFNWVYVRLDFACAKIAIFALFRDTSSALAKTHAVFFYDLYFVHWNCIFTLFWFYPVRKISSLCKSGILLLVLDWMNKNKTSAEGSCRKSLPRHLFSVATPLCASKSALLNPADRVRGLRALDQTPLRCASRPHRDYVHVVQLYIINQYVVKKQHTILTRA